MKPLLEKAFRLLIMLSSTAVNTFQFRIHPISLLDEHRHHYSERNPLRLKPLMFKPLLPVSRSKLTHHVSFLSLTLQNILVGNKSLQAYRPSCMYPSRTDTHLRTEPIPEPIGEPCTRVYERTGGVDAPTEQGGGIGVFGYYGICMV